MDLQYDVLVIGGGPAGFRAGITAVGLGAKVCIIEKDYLGGVCVNRGCVPTKTLINSAVLYDKIKKSYQYGIKTDNPVVDFPVLINRVETIIEEIKGRIEIALKANKVEIMYRKAKLVSQSQVKVDDKKINAKKIIIASGSKPLSLKNLPFSDKVVSSSTFLADLFKNKKLPKKVLIVGAGYIGCEWASMLSYLGVSVTLVEAQNKILPNLDNDLTRPLESAFTKMGVELRLNSTDIEGSWEKTIVCIGREPVAFGADMLDTQKGGWIKVNEKLQTSLNNIYAVGDVNGPPLLAYTAERDGETAARNALGEDRKIDNRAIPSVIFSVPEIAVVGVLEGENVKTVRAHFKGVAKALIDDELQGMVKIAYDKSSYKLLGVGIVGKSAGELINEAVFALRYGLTVKEWKDKIWPHPVLSEIFSMALNRINYDQ